MHRNPTQETIFIIAIFTPVLPSVLGPVLPSPMSGLNGTGQHWP